jgi:hypothetical protein
VGGTNNKMELLKQTQIKITLQEYKKLLKYKRDYEALKEKVIPKKGDLTKIGKYCNICDGQCIETAKMVCESCNADFGVKCGTAPKYPHYENLCFRYGRCASCEYTYTHRRPEGIGSAGSSQIYSSVKDIKKVGLIKKEIRDMKPVIQIEAVKKISDWFLKVSYDPKYKYCRDKQWREFEDLHEDE